MGVQWYKYDHERVTHLSEISLEEVKARMTRLLLVVACLFLLPLTYFWPALLIPWCVTVAIGVALSGPILSWDGFFPDRGDHGRGRELDPIGELFLLESGEEDGEEARSNDLLGDVILGLLMIIHGLVVLPVILVQIGLLHRLKPWGRLRNAAASAVGKSWPFWILILGHAFARNGHLGSAKALGLIVGLDAIGDVCRLFARMQMGRYKHRRVIALAGRLVRLSSVLRAGLIVVLSFALIYFAMGLQDSTSFNHKMSEIDCIYFSVVTAATVGYGDFSPTSDPAKLFCMSEIVLGFLFVVVVFSSVLSVWQKYNVSEGPDAVAERGRKPPEEWDVEILAWI